MNLDFTKMTGAGNDFVVVDNRSGAIKEGSDLARKLCDRRWGIGADGLLLIEESKHATYRMMYYNADGSYGGMCGNGGRCIAYYAVRKGIAQAEHQFEALDHVYRAVVRGEQVTLSMKDPTAYEPRIVLPINGKRLPMSFLDTGAPHVVVAVDELGRKGVRLERVPVERLGHTIRNHKRFNPDGTNVNFVERDGAKMLRIRTYERGVESETLACGTGSIAAAIIGSLEWEMKTPIEVVPRSGVKLFVEFDLRGKKVRNVRLTGPAKILFEGRIPV